MSTTSTTKFFKSGPKRNKLQKLTDIFAADRMIRDGRPRSEILKFINDQGRNYSITRQQLAYDLAKAQLWRAQIWHHGDFDERARPRPKPDSGRFGLKDYQAAMKDFVPPC